MKGPLPSSSFRFNSSSLFLIGKSYAQTHSHTTDPKLAHDMNAGTFTFIDVSFQPLRSSFSPAVVLAYHLTAVESQLKLRRHMRAFTQSSAFRFKPCYPGYAVSKLSAASGEEYKRVEMHLLSFFLFSYSPTSTSRQQKSFLHTFVRTNIHSSKNP